MGANKNGVIITVYVESLSNHTKNNIIQSGTKKKKSKAKSLTKPILKRGYNRRSQLLAYAQSLRNSNRHEPTYHHPQQCSNKNKSPLKSKKWRWSPVRFNGLWYLLKKPRKYNNRHRKGFQEQSEVDCLLGNSRKRKAGKTSYSQFWRRLRSFCIGLACGRWQCNREAEHRI